MISLVTASSKRSSKVSNGTKSHSSRGSRTSAIIDRKTDTAVKVTKLKTKLDFAKDEAAKIAKMKATDQVEETQSEFSK